MTTIDDALGTRHATLQDLATLLRGQKARKIDVIAPASAIRACNGLILLDDTVPEGDEVPCTLCSSLSLI